MFRSRLFGSLCAALLWTGLWPSGPSAAAIDSTSGASIHVVPGGTTGPTTAILHWQENKVNGHMCLFWDTDSTKWNTMRDSTCWSFSSYQLANGTWVANVRPSADTIRNLVPGTLYHYALQGYYPVDHTGMGPAVLAYATHGTFTTDASAGILGKEPKTSLPTPTWDPSGRPSLPGRIRVGASGVSIAP